MVSEVGAHVERGSGQIGAPCVRTRRVRQRARVGFGGDAFPFDADDASRQPWVVFASEASAIEDLLDATGALDPDVDPVRRGDGVVYWNPVKGTTVDTPFAKLLAKAKYKPVTTNRNLRTLRKILG